MADHAVNISTTDIVRRLKHALQTLSEADPDLMELREKLGENDWYRFTSHAAG